MMNTYRAADRALQLLGRVTAGVVHDLRNVLNGLSLQIQLLQRDPAAADPRVAESIACMRRELGVGLDLLRRVNDFGRPQSSWSMSPVRLDDIAVEAIELAKVHVAPECAARSELRRNLRSPPAIAGNHAELVSAVLNLVLNAIDATRGKGPVEVRTGAANRRAWLQVADEGQGMSPEIEGHAFEAFFTTQGAHGTGLGLASVAACVERHGGEIRVQTAPGRGTTIALYFPCDAD